MKAKELLSLGVKRGAPMDILIETMRGMSSSGMKKGAQRKIIKNIVKTPSVYFNDERFGKFAQSMALVTKNLNSYTPRDSPVQFRQWGSDIEPGAITQMKNACMLPVAVTGALMPDAHLGYGLPIGGVLATKNAVIPYAVGMDIACQMRLSVLDIPLSYFEKKQKAFVKALENETAFGVGVSTKNRYEHKVMDEDWAFCSFIKTLKNRAHNQLGTSGSGNHFVEFGVLTLEHDELNLKPGRYLSVLSHSGSRGAGADIATHYSKLAMEMHGELPKELMHLSWLDIDGEPGQEYWESMELMGRYASAGHDLIHENIFKSLRTDAIATVSNHHNFAWKESYDGEDVIVHRKGATPASKGVVGIIPGSMATPGYVVKGLGCADSLNSASHGAGRKMSRKAALKRYTWEDANRFLKKQGVKLLSSGLDEIPMAYKDIHQVMEAQKDLVKPIARFDPKLVKMAP